MRRKLEYLLVTLLLLPTAAWTQEVIALHGRVTAEGKGVPYATIQLQGTSVGVSCNDNGDYDLKLPPGHESDTLVIRSVGYIGHKATVAQLQKNGHVRLKTQVVELQAVEVTSFRSSRHLLNEVVARIKDNYHQSTAWSTFFYRDWRTVDGELFLFDEAVMSVRRSPYSKYADKRGYFLDPTRREMESNLKTLLRHRLVVYDRKLLESKVIKSLGRDQMLAYADDEDFFDPVATPQASFSLAKRMLREHVFEPLQEFTADGEDYYFVRSIGPSRRPKSRVRYEYTIRKRDLALVRLVTSQMPLRCQAPNDAWVNWYYNTMVMEADSSLWTYEVRDGHYTLTRYFNTKSYHLESRGRGHDGQTQHWQQCLDWVLTDFSLNPVPVVEQPLSVYPQTLAGAFGSSDFSPDFWGHYNAVPIDTLPLRLLNEKLSKP